MLDFDSVDARKQPPVDTTWQQVTIYLLIVRSISMFLLCLGLPRLTFCQTQIYFCLRTGYYDEAKHVAQSSRVAYHFAPMVLYCLFMFNLL